MRASAFAHAPVGIRFVRRCPQPVIPLKNPLVPPTHVFLTRKAVPIIAVVSASFVKTIRSDTVLRPAKNAVISRGDCSRPSDFRCRRLCRRKRRRVVRRRRYRTLCARQSGKDKKDGGEEKGGASSGCASHGLTGVG